MDSRKGTAGKLFYSTNLYTQQSELNPSVKVRAVLSKWQLSLFSGILIVSSVSVYCDRFVYDALWVLMLKNK